MRTQTWTQPRRRGCEGAIRWGVMGSGYLLGRRHVGMCCREGWSRNVRVEYADPTQSSSRAVSDGES
jgi:hypothetical protein